MVHKGAFCRPLLASVLCLGVFLLTQHILEQSWWLPGPSSLIFQLLGPREELSVALTCHGAAALTRDDTEQLQS